MTDKDTVKRRWKAEDEMREWRMGLREFPRSYIEMHADAAKAALGELEAAGLRIIATEMISDGWMDGMRVLRVIAEETAIGPNHGKLHDIRWGDSNGGGWWEKLPGGGSTRFKAA